jgi:hypothetical protein
MKKVFKYNEYINSDFIEIDNIIYVTKNSNNEYITKDINSLKNFYKWFGESKMVDSQNRPLVCYHISNNKFDEFKPSIFGKMGSGIYFTSIKDDLKIHNKYGSGIIYNCYLKIENMLILDNPFSKRNEADIDGIVAFKNKQGEEIKVYLPNQIKSIDNDGSFDIDDNNIYS